MDNIRQLREVSNDSAVQSLSYVFLSPVLKAALKHVKKSVGTAISAYAIIGVSPKPDKGIGEGNRLIQNKQVWRVGRDLWAEVLRQELGWVEFGSPAFTHVLTSKAGSTTKT
jgi:hypothetical protein